MVGAPGSWGSWFSRRNSASDMFSRVQFGPAMGECLAWIHDGGGLELTREMFAEARVYSSLCGMILEGDSQRRGSERPADARLRPEDRGDAALRRRDPAANPGRSGRDRILAAGDGPASGLPQCAEISTLSRPAPAGDPVQPVYLAAGPERAVAQLPGDRRDRLQRHHPRHDGQGRGAAMLRHAADATGRGELRRWPASVLVAFEDAWNAIVAETSAETPDFARVGPATLISAGITGSGALSASCRDLRGGGPPRHASVGTQRRSDLGASAA